MSCMSYSNVNMKPCVCLLCGETLLVHNHACLCACVVACGHVGCLCVDDICGICKEYKVSCNSSHKSRESALLETNRK